MLRRNRLKAEFAGWRNTGLYEVSFLSHVTICNTMLAQSLSCISLFLYPFCGPRPHFFISVVALKVALFGGVAGHLRGKTGSVTHTPVAPIFNVCTPGAQGRGIFSQGQKYHDWITDPAWRACGNGFGISVKKRNILQSLHAISETAYQSKRDNVRPAGVSLNTALS